VLGEYNKDSADPVHKLLEVQRDHAYTTHTYKHTTMGFLRDIEDMPNQFTFTGVIHADNWQAFLDTVLPMLTDPGLREEDFRRIKDQQRSALLLDLRDSNEEELGKERLQANLFGGTTSRPSRTGCSSSSPAPTWPAAPSSSRSESGRWLPRTHRWRCASPSTSWTAWSSRASPPRPWTRPAST
jgi:hypothetical protein